MSISPCRAPRWAAFAERRLIALLLVVPRLISLRLTSILLVIAVAASCDAVGSNGGGDVEAGVDLDALFAPANRSEIDLAAGAWEGRDVSAREVSLVYEGELTHAFAPDWASDLRIYAHAVDGHTHYGAVITPHSTQPSTQHSTQHPVLLFLHGGDAGVRMDDVALALALLPEVRDEYVVVVPSFRSEPLVVGGETFQSEGAPSPWDRDVDDTLALLNVAFEVTPGADAERVVAVGFSRGGTVALLAAIRDERIGGVASFSAPTDFLGAFSKDLTRAMLRGNLPGLPGTRTIYETLLEPLQARELAMSEVRVDLIRRSPVYFADRLPAVQIHHGLNDPIVPPAEAQQLVDALERDALDGDARGDDELGGAGRTSYEAYFYPSGGHDPLSLNGALDHLTTFLRQWTNLPA